MKMCINIGRFYAAAIVSLALVQGEARADSITLTPSVDTTLFEFSPDNNLGGYPDFAVGTTAHAARSRAVIKFNVAANLPAGAVITSARLKLIVTKTPLGGGVPSAFSLYRVLQDWGEGDKALASTGQPATDGEATWNNRFHPSSPWSVPGGLSGTDYAEGPSTSAAISGVGTYFFDGSAEMRGDIAHWLNTPAENFGWIVISDDEASFGTARRIASRESGSSSPELQIDYIIPFEISGFSRKNSTLNIFFTADAGNTYTVEYRGNVDGGTWSTLTNITARLASFEATASDSTTNAPRRFYRVRKEPCLCR